MGNVFMQDHESWLLIAQEDLDSAKYLLTIPFVTALFHTQQCAEKALKAYILFKKNLVIKTHDLIRLVDICVENDRGFDSLPLFATIVDPYQTAGRYPEPGFIRPSIEEITGIIAQAEFILHFVIDRCYFHKQSKVSKKKSAKITKETHLLFLQFFLMSAMCAFRTCKRKKGFKKLYIKRLVTLYQYLHFDL
jgi:HEPN domain-containing protein